MTTMRHTPAPWRAVGPEMLEDGSVYPPHIEGGARALEICHFSDWTASDAMAESATDVRSKRANARLIAAAPDLLMALRAFLHTPSGVRMCTCRDRLGVLTQTSSACCYCIARDVVRRAMEES